MKIDVECTKGMGHIESVRERVIKYLGDLDYWDSLRGTEKPKVFDATQYKNGFFATANKDFQLGTFGSNILLCVKPPKLAIMQAESKKRLIQELEIRKNKSSGRAYYFGTTDDDFTLDCAIGYNASCGDMGNETENKARLDAVKFVIDFVSNNGVLTLEETQSAYAKFGIEASNMPERRRTSWAQGEQA